MMRETSDTFSNVEDAAFDNEHSPVKPMAVFRERMESFFVSISLSMFM
jgi:hypothetical protein